MKTWIKGAVGLIMAVGGLLVWANYREKPLPRHLKADLIIVEKSARRLTLYRDGRPLKTYSVALGRNPVGRKTARGDNRTPEGVYYIDSRKTGSAYHRALHISYPHSHDSKAARRRGVPPGGDVMIHGLPNGLGWLGKLHRLVDWTAGLSGGHQL